MITTSDKFEGTEFGLSPAPALTFLQGFYFELGILGWKFALVRFTTTFLFPPIAGLLAQILFSNVKL